MMNSALRQTQTRPLIRQAQVPDLPSCAAIIRSNHLRMMSVLSLPIHFSHFFCAFSACAIAPATCARLRSATLAITSPRAGLVTSKVP